MYWYRVSKSELLTPTVRLLTLVPKKATQKPLLYQPGQYAAISLHDKLRPTTTRSFSLCSSPTQGNFLQFSIRVQGKFTSALERLKEGDIVSVRGSFGSFVFNEHAHALTTFFAGGIGIAPFMSMIRYATDTGVQNGIRLVYSVKTENDVPFFNELQKLEKTNPNFSVTYVVGDGQIDRLRDTRAVPGTLDGDVVDSLELAYDKETYMVCGPPRYMSAVQTLLEERGVPRRNILTEAFSQGSARQSSRLTYWPFNVYALTGLLLVVGTGFVAATDLNKTLPKLTQTQSGVSEGESLTSVLVSEGESLLEKINEIEPLVDTDIEQEPIVTYIPNPANTKPAGQTPVVAPAVTQEQVITPVTVVKTTTTTKKVTQPTKTTTSTTPPRSTVS